MREQIKSILAELGSDTLSRQQRMARVLPTLQKIQRALGYLPREGVRQVAEALGLPESHLYGVATFYSQFRFSPPGKNSITVCCGTACHVRGSARLLADLERRLGIKPGETTSDLNFSLDSIACFGSCALAPVVVINGKVRGRMNRSRLFKAVDELSAVEADAGRGELSKGG
jgi:NADH:ubiquinone oxidoreductase subunit E